MTLNPQIPILKFQIISKFQILIRRFRRLHRLLRTWGRECEICRA